MAPTKKVPTQVNKLTAAQKKAYNEMDIDALLKEVRPHPCLYKASDKDHKNNAKKTKIWADIDTALGLDNGLSQLKFRGLRTIFFQKKNQLKEATSSGSAAAEKPIKWAHYDALRFLDDPEATRPLSSNLTIEDLPHSSRENDDQEQSEEEDVLQSRSHTPSNMCASMTSEAFSDNEENDLKLVDEEETSKKKKIKPNKWDSIKQVMVDVEKNRFSMLKDLQGDDSGGDRSFVVSLLPILKKMSYYDKLQFRARVCAMVAEYVPREPSF